MRKIQWSTSNINYIPSIENRNEINSMDFNFESTSYKIERFESVESIQYGERVLNPQISIMIPTYKRKELLCNAIQSVIDQNTKYLYEIVVVDNNPDTSDIEIDEILQKYSDYNISYFKNKENIGMFGNWNRCILLSNSEWIVILSDDDELENDYINKMMDTTKLLSGCGAITCRYNQIDAIGKYITNHKRIPFSRDIIKLRIQDFYWNHPVAFFGCLFRKDIALKVGGFRTEYYPCSDAVFLMNICSVSSLYLVNDFLFKYRWAANESLNKKTQLSFLNFNDKKSKFINQKYSICSNWLDNFYRTGVIELSVSDLLKTCNIDKNDALDFLNQLNQKKYICKFRVFFVRLIRKYRKILLELRDAR